jgi:MFS family permease
VTSAPPARTFEVRHLQIARAAFAALAAIMVTFSPDHSAVVGMAVFSGFAIATGIVLLLAVWLVYPTGRRWPAVVLGGAALAAGMVGGLPLFRTITGYFATVIVWALVSGAIEAISGWRALRFAKRPETLRREIAPGVVDSRPVVEPGPVSESRDAVVIGIATLLLGLALLFVPTQYALQYTIEEARATFTLTGITIGVGIFGAYTAIVAVYLAIAGFSPRNSLVVTTEATAALPTDQKDPA